MKPMTTPRIQGIPDLGAGLRLHLNENTGGCSPRVVEAVRAFDARRLATYPDYRAAVIETAAFLGVDPEWLVLTNGLDEGVLLTAMAYLGPTGGAVRARAEGPAPPARRPRCVIALPAFETYVSTAKAVGARIVSVPPGPDFAFPPTPCWPRSRPTRGSSTSTTRTTRPGSRCRRTRSARVARAAAHALVFVDEAYHDFMGENFLEEARAYPERARSAARSPRRTAWPACASAR